MARSKRRRRRARGRSLGQLADAAPLVVLGATVVLAPQLLGGVFGWGIALTATGGALACLAAAYAARRARTPAPVSAVGLAALTGLAFTALQATPLPRWLTAWLQPGAVEAQAEAARLLGEAPPEWVALSYSPFGTRAELVKGAAIVSVFFASSLMIAHGKRRDVARLVAASVTLMAIVALGHLVLDADAVFGVYRATETVTSLTAPLLNQNHLSGFLAAGVPLLIGLGLDADERGKTIGYSVAAATVGATSLLAASRGGVASLLCGVLVLGAIGLIRRRDTDQRVSTPLLVIAATLAVTVGLGLYVASEALFQEFEHGDISKLTLAANSFDVALDHPFVGVGRGAFSAVFVGQHGAGVRFTHPENLIAQWTTEWGLVVGTGMLVTLGVAAVRAGPKARSWVRLGALAALASLGVHELVDFSTELVGVGAVAAALAAVALAPRRSKSTRAAPRVPLRRAAWAVGAVSLAVALWLGPSLDATSAHSLRARLEGLLTSDDAAAFERTLTTAVRLHPREPVFPLLAGAEGVQRNDPRALAWLNRAMVLAPGWDAPHQQTALYLAQRGRTAQAFLELREAQTRRPRAPELACQILERRPEAVEDLIHAATDDAVGTEWLNAVATCLPARAAPTERIDEALIERGQADAAVRRATRQLQDDEPEAALATLSELEESALVPRAKLARARAHLALGQPRRAIAALEGAERWPADAEPGLTVRARAQAQVGDMDAMRATTELLRERAAGDPQALARVWLLEGELEEGAGDAERAIAAYEHAVRIGRLPAALSALARAAEGSGRLGHAIQAHSQLCASQGRDSAHCAAAARLRAGNLNPGAGAGN